MQKYWWWLVGASSISCLVLGGKLASGAASGGPLSTLDAVGIDARRLQAYPFYLTGKKIAIGQVELGRPAAFRLDKAASAFTVLQLEQVFFQDKSAESNSLVDKHATMVANVMISQDKARPGVSPNARLYATAVGLSRQTSQAKECVASQFIAQQNGGDVRAINYSFGDPLGKPPRSREVLDGSALLTQCLDWSARVHNVLHVVAGNQGRGGIPIPTDNYNGVNVAYSVMRDGVYRKVDFANLSELPVGTAKKIGGKEINSNDRRSISLLAPGTGFTLYDLDGKIIKINGTSFAAPQVTSTVALLQEYGDRRLRAASNVNKLNIDPLAPLSSSNPQWGLAARQHEVMKAVMLNSADKIQDLGNGLRLGMTRTVLTKTNKNWLESETFQDPKHPLDYQMGTGHLNAFRAYQQFQPGQWSPNTMVPPIGWDYNQVSTYRDYQLGSPLAVGSFVAITLAWDRQVELLDSNKNGEFEDGESFLDRGLNNLDIYLMHSSDNDIRQSIWSSTSNVDSVEHIFHQITSSGTYKIRVQMRDQQNTLSQPYALAWWTAPEMKMPPVPETAK
jgi:subtilisin family serine protease